MKCSPLVNKLFDGTDFSRGFRWPSDDAPVLASCFATRRGRLDVFVRGINGIGVSVWRSDDKDCAESFKKW